MQTDPLNETQMPVDRRLLEATLLPRARAGDQEALDRLLLPHRRALYGLCRNILGADEDAEDAVQETYLCAIRSLVRFRGSASEVKTWLYRIAINVCLQEKRSRTRTLSLQTPLCPAPQAPSLEQNVLTRQQVDAALAGLLPRHRVVFLLREWNGWSVGEIARTMQCTDRRVNNELYHVRCMLQAWALRQRQEEDAL